MVPFSVDLLSEKGGDNIAERSGRPLSTFSTRVGGIALGMDGPILRWWKFLSLETGVSLFLFLVESSTRASLVARVARSFP